MCKSGPRSNTYSRKSFIDFWRKVPRMESDATYISVPELQGDDCGWQIIHSYYRVCDGIPNELVHKEFFQGADQSAPELTGEIPTGGSDLNLCLDQIPAGPTEAFIAMQFTDNCGDVIVHKSGEPVIDGCDWSVIYTYTVTDSCNPPNVYEEEVKVEYSGSDNEAPTLSKGCNIASNFCKLRKLL